MGYAGRHHTSEPVLPNKFLQLVSVFALLLLLLACRWHPTIVIWRDLSSEKPKACYHQLAGLGVYFQLDQPASLIMDTFDSTAISSIWYLVGVVCLLMVLFVVIRLTKSLYKNHIIKKVENDSNSNEIYPTPRVEETLPFTIDEHVLWSIASPLNHP